MLKILFFGDIFGKLGRKGLKKILPELKSEYQPDLIIANVENLAHGRGITDSTIKELEDIGIEVFTSGNHVWDKPAGHTLVSKKNSAIIRPANYPENTPGQSEKLLKIGLNSILVVNLIGRVFFREDFDCPFKAIDNIIKKYEDKNLAGIVIDFHAEASSEKMAMGHFLDGKASAVLGTHTHVQTADEKILSKGTAYISDVGMTGPQDSVIGLDKEVIIKNFLSQINKSADVPQTGICQINGVYLEINPKNKKTTKIIRINQAVEI